MPTVTQRRSSRSEQMLLFAKNFFKHPKMLGSIIPSSRFLIEHVLRQIDWKRARVIVEYGPGVGTFTREILHRMSPDSVLVVVETNRDFVHFLENSLPDPRLRVVYGSAADIRSILAELGLERADYVISGIPFSAFPEQLREDIVRETCAAIRSGGAFLVYQFTPKVLPYLEKSFRRVTRSFEPLNVPPAQLFFSTP